MDAQKRLNFSGIKLDASGIMSWCSSGKYYNKEKCAIAPKPNYSSFSNVLASILLLFPTAISFLFFVADMC